MSLPALSAEDMLAWNDRTAKTWRDLVEHDPGVLLLECDIFGVSTVSQLLHHIVAVETRYAQRLACATETPFDAIPYSTAAEIFGAHDAAMEIIRAEVAKDDDWDAKLQFQTLTMGLARASRKTVFFHALMHSVRHYAQLATLVRQHGFKTSFPMDYLAMGIERVE